MAEQIGIVLHDEMNGWARVVTDRKGACGGCSPSSGACSSCLANAKLESRVSNPINAKTGDVVKITLSSAVVLKGAAILYLLPIVLLILGAVGGMWIGDLRQWPNTVGAASGSMAGLVAGFWAVVRLGRSRKLSRQMTPAITAIVVPSDNSVKKINASCCG